MNFTYLLDMVCSYRLNLGLRIICGKGNLVWIYIAVKGFYIFMTQIKFIHYKLLHHIRNLKGLHDQLNLLNKIPLSKLVTRVALHVMYRLSILMSDVSLMQAVREVYEVVPARRWSEMESRMNKIVVIGKTQLITSSSVILYFVVISVCWVPQVAIWISMFFKSHLAVARADNVLLSLSCTM
jgi:hypothetical protein